jgi:anti-sigma B factor antagonist
MQQHSHDRWSPRARRVRPVYERRRGGRTEPRTRFFSKREFAVRCAREGDREVVAAAGRLDLSSAWELERELRRAEATDARVILVDLAGLASVDAVGMEVVMHALARARYHGKRLMIVPGPDAVQRSFQRSGLTWLLPFVDPAAAALR